MAAGYVGVDGDTANRPHFSFGGLKVRPIASSLYQVLFDKFDRDRLYVVKGTPVLDGARGSAVHVFEVVEDPDYLKQRHQVLGDGLHVRVGTPPGGESEGFAFMIEISDYTEVV